MSYFFVGAPHPGGLFSTVIGEYRASMFDNAEQNLMGAKKELRAST